MARYMKYLDMNVVEAAKKRLHHTYDIFDHVVVMFSGGKDSGTCLELCRQVREERGDSRRVVVMFIDEEIIQPEVPKFVEKFRHYDWCELHWSGIKLKSTKFLLGEAQEIVFWDPNREHVRDLPPWALRDRPEDPPKRLQEIDLWVDDALGLTGKIAHVTGIRASESLIRYRSCVNKLNESYIVGSSRPGTCLVKPIYDWQQNDVMKFLYESGAGWVESYDTQLLVHERMRVSTALHPESAKRFFKVREMYPEFYDRILKVFPEMQLQERYWHSLDRKGVVDEYSAYPGLEGCYKYIEDHVQNPQKRETALKTLATYETLHANDPGMYTPILMLKTLIGGAFHRLPVGDRKKT